jgi:glyoxylate/hydroxypyruvate reductase A
MGVGEMGRASANGLMALGFNVIGWSRTPKPDLPFTCYSGPGETERFLERTNILVSLLPSTPETRGLIGRETFRKLSRGGPFGDPVFINAGRGDAVDEAGLLAALQDGTLRAASLDVFVKEPLPAGSPFWDMPNAVITPHNAADSHPDAIVAAIMEEIRRFEAGEPLLNPVDRSRGY